MKHLYKIILVLVLQMGFSLGGWSQKLTLAEDAVLGIQVGGFSFVTGAIQLKGTSELIGPEAIILKNSTFIQLQGSGVKLRTREMKPDGLVEIPVGIDSKTVLSIHNKDVAASYGISMEELNEADALPFSWMIKATTSGGQAISDLAFSWEKSIEPEIFENKALVKKNQTAWEVLPDQVIGDTLVNLEGFSDYGSQETIFSVKNISTQLDAVGTVTDISCFDEADGSINLTVFGGTPPYSFKWSNRRTSEDISSLVAGIYKVRIRDASGAVILKEYTVVSPSLLVITSSQTDLSTCDSDETGSITPSASGGKEPYLFTLNTGQDLVDGKFTGLAAGTYTLMVQDANNCTKIKSVTIRQASAVAFTSTKADITSCASNGVITVNATGGQSPYQYSKDGGVNWQLSNTFTGLAAQSYPVVIKDNLGCISVISDVVISDDGSDAYESNNTLKSSKAISLESTIQARIGLGGDVDWFRFTTPRSKSNTNYYVEFSSPTIGQTVKVYNSKGSLITPKKSGVIDGSTASVEIYELSSRTTYFIKVSGTQSLACYELKVSATLNEYWRLLENQPEENQPVNTPSAAVQSTETAADQRAGSAEGSYDVIAYPNPSNGLFKLLLPGFAAGEARMRIVDGVGKLILEEVSLVENEKRLGTIDLTTVAKGLYYVQVIQDRKVKMIRVVLK